MKRAFAVMLVGLLGVVGGCETPPKPMPKQAQQRPMTATINQGGQPGYQSGAQPGAYGGVQSAQPGGYSSGVQQSGLTGYQPGMNSAMPAGGVVPSPLPGGAYQGNVRNTNYLGSPSMANANGQ